MFQKKNSENKSKTNYRFTKIENILKMFLTDLGKIQSLKMCNLPLKCNANNNNNLDLD